MDRQLNIMRREAMRAGSQVATVRIGVVTSYDPNNYAAKVLIQPEGYETGFLPVTSPWSGNGWGLFCPPTSGDVVDVHFQEGGKQAGFIALRHYGDQLRPLPVPSGEFWVVHQSGSFLKFHNDGTIAMTGESNINIVAPSVNVTGNLNVTGDIIDRCLTGGDTMASFRATYDEHRHGGVQTGGGTTSAPLPPDVI